MNLKLTVKLAAAALLSASPALVFASSITPPTAGPVPGTGAAGGSGLIIEVWNPTTFVGMVEWLGPTYSTFAPGGALNPTNAAGASYDFGVIGGASTFASVFGSANPTSGSLDFAVFAANTDTANAFSLETTGPLTGLGTVRNSTVTTAVNSLLTQIGNFGDANPLTFASASDQGGVFVTQIGTKIHGAFGSGVSGTNGGGALGFYTATQTSSTGTNPASVSTYGNATGAGSFSLSANGDLVYSLAGPVVTPLPAAVWLFGSGLLGLIGVGRRRVNV